MNNTPRKTNPAFNPESLIDLVQVGQLLTSTFDLDEILELIMGKVSQLVKAENWSLLLKDEETDDLTFKVVVGSKEDALKGKSVPSGEGIAGCVACSGDSEFVTDAQNDPRLFRSADQFTGFITRSIACIPLVSHGVCLGVIEIVNIEDMDRSHKDAVGISDLAALEGRMLDDENNLIAWYGEANNNFGNGLYTYFVRVEDTRSGPDIYGVGYKLNYDIIEYSVKE